MIYYTIWVLLYQVYNPVNYETVWRATRCCGTWGPNLLFYIQVFSVLHIIISFMKGEIQLTREKELIELAHNAEISILKAQIQPHFLFNTLNSISASLPYEQENSRVLIARLADTFRYALLFYKRRCCAPFQRTGFYEDLFYRWKRRGLASGYNSILKWITLSINQVFPLCFYNHS